MLKQSFWKRCYTVSDHLLVTPCKRSNIWRNHAYLQMFRRQFLIVLRPSHQINHQTLSNNKIYCCYLKRIWSYTAKPKQKGHQQVTFVTSPSQTQRSWTRGPTERIIARSQTGYSHKQMAAAGMGGKSRS